MYFVLIDEVITDRSFLLYQMQKVLFRKKTTP